MLSTKIFWGGPGPNDTGLTHKHIIEGIHATLAPAADRLRRPVFLPSSHIRTPIEETVRAMDNLVASGKIFYWGTSEWARPTSCRPSGFTRPRGLAPPTMEQPQYNMVRRERFEKEYAKLYREIGLGTTIWSPLASGILTGKYSDGVPERHTRVTLPGYEWLKADRWKALRARPISLKLAT